MWQHGRNDAPSTPGRRAMLRCSLLAGALALNAGVAACSGTWGSDPTGGRSAADTEGGQSGDAGMSSSPESTRTADGSPRVLVAYFSRPGENYYYGGRIDLDVGNTEVLVGAIGRRLTELAVAHDVHRIEPDDPYPWDYEETVARNVREQDADARPAIADPLDSIEDYDVILLGSPIWNVRPPMIMHTFAERYDFTQKTVHPFTTHAMSGLGRAMQDYAEVCRGATLGEGLAVQGEEVRQAGPDAVATWLDRIDLTIMQTPAR